MAADLQTSFIPRTSITDIKPPSRRSGIGVVTLAAIILLLLVMIGYGGLFAYGKWLDNEIGTPQDPCTLGSGTRCSLNASIKRIEDKVRRELITEIKQTGEKILLAEKLINGRSLMTPVFALLEDTALTSVQMTEFTYKIGDPVRIKGIARGYEPVALQSDAFEASKGISSFHISDLTLDSKTGNVTFIAELSLNPSVLRGQYSAEETVETSSTTPQS